jgi:hypothetical protein
MLSFLMLLVAVFGGTLLAGLVLTSAQVVVALALEDA